MTPVENQAAGTVAHQPLELEALSSSSSSTICFFGTYERKRVTRITVLLEGLIEHGYLVHECNEPLGLVHEDKLRLLKRPWRIFSLIGHILRAWVRLWKQSKTMPAPSLVLVPYMGHFDILLARLRFRGVPILLDHMIFAEDTARDRRAPFFIVYMLRFLDMMAMSLANVIILDTPEHAKLVPAHLHDRSIVVPIGAPASWLAATEPDGKQEEADPDRLRIIFFGLFTPLQGVETIARSLLILKEQGVRFSVTMVGRGQDYLLARQLLGALDEITWVDWLDEADLLACVRKHQVCLGIFGSSAKSQRVVPQKLFLGAAAGCVIVTSETPPQRRVFENLAYYVHPGDAFALAGTLARLASNLEALSGQRLASQEFAQETFRPETVTAPLAERIRHFATPGHGRQQCSSP
jgi:glycosyltransferase involved in cell wall biosynthesis